MTTINNLPVELLPFIFKYLGIKDLTRARSVCKIWRKLCDQEKVDELVIKCQKNSFVKKRWYHLNKKIDHDNVIVMDVFGAKCETFKRKLVKLSWFQELKRLSIKGVSETHDLLHHLHLFTKLEQFDYDVVFDYDSFVTISHPNIQILSIDLFSERYLIDMNINAEKLRVLECSGYYGRLNFTWPESLIKLETSLIDHTYDNPDESEDYRKLSSFVNLQEIHTDTDNWNPVILGKLPNLKKFIFMSITKRLDYDDYFVLCESLIGLLKMKKKLGRTGFMAYHDNTELITVKQTRQFLQDYYEMWSDRSDREELEDETSSDTDESVEDVIMIE